MNLVQVKYRRHHRISLNTEATILCVEKYSGTYNSDHFKRMGYDDTNDDPVRYPDYYYWIFDMDRWEEIKNGMRS